MIIKNRDWQIKYRNVLVNWNEFEIGCVDGNLSVEVWG